MYKTAAVVATLRQFLCGPTLRDNFKPHIFTTRSSSTQPAPRPFLLSYFDAALTTLTKHEVDTICCCAAADDDVSRDDPGTQPRELQDKQARKHSVTG